jgi:hypothetical protein
MSFADLQNEPDPSTRPELGITRQGMKDDFGFTDMAKGADEAGYVPPDRTPHGVMGKIIDVVSRGQYASAALVSYSDLIKKYAPGFAEKNRKTTAVLGFIGDVALDPTTYLTLGTSSAATKMGIRVGSTTGKAALQAEKGALRFMQRGVKKALAQGDDEVMVRLSKEGQKKLGDITQELMEQGGNLTADGLKYRHKLIDGLRKKGYSNEDAVLMANREIKRLADANAVVGKKRAAGFVEEFTPELLEQTAQQRMSRMIASSPAFAEEVVSTGGVRFMGKQVLSGVHLKKFNEAVGITTAKELLAATAPIKWGSAVLTQKIPTEFKTIWQKLNSDNMAAERQVKAKAAAIFGDLGKESRLKIGKLGTRVDDLTTQARKSADAQFEDQQVKLAEYMNSLKAAGGGPPDQRVIDALNTRKMVDEKAILRREVNDARLTAEEHSAFVSMMSEMDRFAKRETELNLLEKLRLNYFPRQYDAINNGTVLSKIRRKAQSPTGTFSPGEARKFESIAQAEKMGFTPIQDAGVLYAMRAMQHHSAVNEKVFRDQADWMLGKLTKKAEKFSPGDSRHWKLQEDAANLKQYIDYVGESKYSNISNKEARMALQMYDRGLRVFKTFATVARPAFAVRQVFSNHVQMFIGAGPKGIKHLYDPRSAYDAALILRGKGTGKVRAGVDITGAFGEKMTGQQLLDESFKHDIVRNVSGVSGLADEPLNKRGSARFMKALDRRRKIQGVGAHSKAAEGMAMGMDKAMRYMNAPAAVEDYSRMAMFVNLRRAGHGPADAARLVDRALFDYQHALSITEDQLIKRAIPFYSFQRFAIPLVTEAAMKTPGRIANVGKAANTLMEVYGQLHTNGKLTDEQRNVLPGWLLEQPHAFIGRDAEMKARFNTFNNYSPLDVFGFMAETDDGDMDVQGSFKNAFLSQLTPIVKVPMEVMLGEDFFTGRSLDDARNLKDVSMSDVLGSMIGLLAGQGAAGTAGVAAGGGIPGGVNPLGAMIEKLPGDVAEATLGRLLGMEEKIDPRTGKRSVYVNAYMVHALTSIAPVLTEAFKVSRQDKSPLDKTKQFLFGISNPEIDIEKSQRRKVKRHFKKARDRRAALAADSISMSMDEYARAQEELQAWEEDWVREYDLMTGNIQMVETPK